MNTPLPEPVSRLAPILCALAFAALTGCAAHDQSPQTEPMSAVQIATPLSSVEPDLKDQRVDNLLDFETDTDALFVHAQPSDDLATTSQKAHSGRASLLIKPGTTQINVKLSDLLEGRTYPGNWTLIGAYFYCDHDTDVTASCASPAGLSPRTVHLTAGQWTPVFIELPAGASPAALSPVEGQPPTTTPATQPAGQELSFHFADTAGQPIFCDDVLLADNARSYYTPPQPSTAPLPTTNSATAPAEPISQWTITRRGLNVQVTSPAQFSMLIETPQASAAGWRVLEAGPLRARFQSGPNQFVTIYDDGRSYWDGHFRALSASIRRDADYQTSNDHPANASIPDYQGHVDRSDPTNSGYDRQRGTYRIVASLTTPMEITLTPKNGPVISPVLEIAHVMPGNVLVTCQGQLVKRVDRLPDGTVLVDLGRRIDKPTLIEVRTQ